MRVENLYNTSQAAEIAEIAEIAVKNYPLYLTQAEARGASY